MTDCIIELADKSERNYTRTILWVMKMFTVENNK